MGGQTQKFAKRDQKTGYLATGVDSASLQKLYPASGQSEARKWPWPDQSLPLISVWLPSGPHIRCQIVDFVVGPCALPPLRL